MDFSQLLFSLVVILLAAKVGGEIAERLGQPAVLGELLLGMLVGEGCFGIIHGNEILHLLSELGAVILLFEIGLQSDLEEFLRVGIWSFLVAMVGVVLPMIGGYGVAIYLGMDTIHAVYLGAVLTATSVGITARVFSDLKKAHTQEARIVIGAAVIDDVLGLMVLAVVMGLVDTGLISAMAIGKITFLSIAFLSLSVLIGILATPFLLRFVAQMRVRGQLLASALIFCFFIAWLANLIGLAAIVGAFAAGLVLAKTEHKVHFETQLKPIADFFIPIFFVMMGVSTRLAVFNPFNAANYPVLMLGGLLIVVGVIGKVLAGYVVFQKKINRLVIGVGMIPRGEVGLIFASFGLSRGLIQGDLYAAILAMVLVTTFITPLLLKPLLQRLQH